ncbi:PilZ domain-containing protein [Pseudorhodobacter sp.]|uniref:PilZ domain-containing protein n=1 Tax=Pseudorhodobacter sp. TaxID=1934400 RepID=UPI0039E441E6
MGKLTHAAVSIFLVTASLATIANANHVCDSINDLKQLHASSAPAQAIDNPLAALKILGHLERSLAPESFRQSSARLQHSINAVSDLTASLRRLGNAPNLGPAALNAKAFQKVTETLNRLRLIESAFGCNVAQETTLASEAMPPKPSRASLGQYLQKTIGIAPTASDFPIVIALALLIGAALFTLTKRRRKGLRKICHLPLLIVHGKNCTVTNILDISRNGAKIEAAAKEFDKGWAMLYFCGHNIEGKIVWRNNLYAGVRFRKRLGKAALQDALTKNHMPIAETNLARNATPCFQIGCHIDCAKHRPTAISLKEQTTDRP